MFNWLKKLLRIERKPKILTLEEVEVMNRSINSLMNDFLISRATELTLKNIVGVPPKGYMKLKKSDIISNYYLKPQTLRILKETKNGK